MISPTVEEHEHEQPHLGSENEMAKTFDDLDEIVTVSARCCQLVYTAIFRKLTTKLYLDCCKKNSHDNSRLQLTPDVKGTEVIIVVMKVPPPYATWRCCDMVLISINCSKCQRSCDCARHCHTRWHAFGQTALDWSEASAHGIDYCFPQPHIYTAHEASVWSISAHEYCEYKRDIAYFEVTAWQTHTVRPCTQDIIIVCCWLLWWLAVTESIAIQADKWTHLNKTS